MPIWTIEIINQSDAVRDYVLFSPEVRVAFDGAPVETYTCAWLTYPGVVPGQSRRSTFSESIFFGLDLNGLTPQPGVMVTNSAATPVDARARDQLQLLNGADGQFFGEVRHDRSSPGSVSVVTPDPLSSPDGPPPASLLVVGKVGDSLVPEAMTAFAPQAGGVFKVWPTTRLNLAQGAYHRGEILPPGLFSDAVLDFGGHEVVTITVTHEPTGVFALSYKYG